MTPEQWQRIKAIVFEASHRDGDARAVFVADACAADADLLDEVTSLLASMTEAEGRFDAPRFAVDLAGPGLQSLVDGGFDVDRTTGAERRFGPYEIRRELGRGGMAAVYLGARVDREFNQDVAIKIIKRGMDTDAIVRRFRIERQILADLDHPYISRLLDGGTTGDGVPYLVMEYVDGQPITTYADEHALTIDDRVSLFRKICDAVAFAHQRLVVHRDIKPSNVLVARDGTPKLLDFGLAKILDATSQDTETNHQWLTPAFASPEQLRGRTITTVSDVYSLGLLLYELLCGVPPFGHLPAGGVELLRAILETEPDKPSAVAVRTDAIVSARRATKPDRLRRTLRGDLDQIVLRALEKDPSRRYAGVQELSEDLRRYQVGLPVSAGRDTFLYHGAKFVRRHTTAVVAAATVAATLVAASAVTMAQARIARRARESAERRFRDVRLLTNTFLFDFHDAIATLPGSTPAREMVVKTAQQYLDGLAREAGTDRGLLSELATAYFKLGHVQGRPSAARTGDTDAALASYSQALALRRRLVALDPGNHDYQHDLAGVLVRMGPIYQVRGDPAAAIALTREGMHIVDGLLASAPTPDVRRTAFRAPLYLGDALYDTGDYDGALTMFQKTLAMAELAREDPPELDYRHRLAVARERLGIMLAVKGDAAQALASYREALRNEEAMSAAEPENADYITLKANGNYYVGDALRALHRYPEALEDEHRALALYEGQLRLDPRNVGPKKEIGGCLLKIAEILTAQGDHDGARMMIERSVTIQRELAALDHGSIEYVDDLADGLMLWGETLMAGRNATGAIEKLEEARALREPITASRPQQAVYARGLARLYTDLGAAYTAVERVSPRHAVNDRSADACRYYRQGRDLWVELERRHALAADDAWRPEAAARSLARCMSRS